MSTTSLWRINHSRQLPFARSSVDRLLVSFVLTWRTESALAAVEFCEARLNRVQANLRIADTLDCDDVCAVDGAERIQTSVHGVMGNTTGCVIQFRDENGTGTATTFTTDKLRTR